MQHGTDQSIIQTNEEQLKEILAALESPGDFGKFLGRFSPAQLSALLIQKGIKNAKRNSFRIRNNIGIIKKKWFS
ncbi:MAG: hypothetical protein V1820_01885, partial [archaeon]